MNLISYIKSHKLISIILLLVIISAIMLPIYFLVIAKSNSSNSSNSSSQVPVVQQEPINYIEDPNQLGFVFQETSNGVDTSYRFMNLEMFNASLSYGKDADTGTSKFLVKRKWVYDNTNISTIERTILNTNDFYSESELSSLGKTNKPNTYLVNQIISIYDKNDPNLQINVTMQIKPMILTTYSNYEKLYKNN